MSETTVNVRYMVDDVEDAIRILYGPPWFFPPVEPCAGFCRRAPRSVAAIAQRADEFGGDGRCQTANSPGRAAGTAFISSLTICLPR